MDGKPVQTRADYRIPGWGPPRFQTHAEERLHRKQRLAAALRLFGDFGWDHGVAGHITARDPEFSDRFWVNPLGRPFPLVRVSDLICVDSDGTVLEGSGHLNRAAFVIHSQIHAARPDVVAACHAHSPFGKVWSTLGRLLDPISQDSAPLFEDHVLYEDYDGVVVDEAEGRRIAATLGPHRGVILQNHGLLSVGRSVDEAAWWFISMERAAEVQYRAETIGTPSRVEPGVARRLSGVGEPIERVHMSGWVQFQPHYDLAAARHPDLFD